MRFLIAAILGAFALGAAQVAEAQTSPEARVLAWAMTLDEVALRIRSPAVDAPALAGLRRDLTQLRLEARSLARTEDARAATSRRLADMIGPAPDEKAAPEAPELAQRRKAYEADARAVEAMVKQARIVVSIADFLIERVDQRRRQLLYSGLVHPQASIYAIDDWIAAYRSIEGSARRSAAKPYERGKTPHFGWFVALLAALLFGVRAMPAIGPEDGRRAGIVPLYRKRLISAAYEVLVHGALLAYGLWALWAVFVQLLLPTQFAADAALGLALGVGAWVATRGLADAALRPAHPEWRLVPLGNGAARRLSQHTARVAVLIGLLFGARLALPEASETALFGETVGAVYALFAAVALLWLLPARLWKPGGAAARSVPRFRPLKEKQVDYWTLLRQGVAILVAAAVVAILIGYGLLGAFVLRNLLIMGLIAGALLLLRTVAREAALSGIEWIETEKGFRVLAEMPTLPRWLVIAAVDLIVVALGLVLVLPLWGFDWGEVVEGLVGLWAGFAVGSVKIHPSDVVLAAATFGLAFAITRWVQRVMDRRLMTNASIDIGVRAALRTGVGYVGIGAAIAAVIGLIGFDLTNFALIAGALSVGIGFGMQNLFNNFVSGIILLIERPIKVGDWVEVGGQQGRVKRIDVRSTEIETDQRSSVMVPNSDILQTAVVNWTLKDRLARIDIRLAVPGTVDIAHIERLLIACAENDPRVSKDAAPHVLLQEIGDDHLEFELRAFVANVDERLFVASDLRKAVLKALGDAGIQSRHANALPLLRAATQAQPDKKL